MLYLFKFPDIGEGIHEGKILEWFVKNGQEIREGDPVVKVETDKVVADIPAPRTGTVKNHFGKVGEVINVGDTLLEMEVEGEAPEPAAPKPAAESIEEFGAGVVGQIELAQSDAFLPASGEGFETAPVEEEQAQHRKALATPVARAMAKDMGLDINRIEGTGPGGRVMKADIQRAARANGRTFTAATISSPPPRAPEASEDREEIEELSQLRKTIIAKMVESKFTAPHSTAFEEVEVSNLVALRDETNKKLAKEDRKISYMPFIIKAVTHCLKKHKKLNCRLDMDNNRVIYRKYYNIGLAVDTPDGLVVPVIKDADQKSIFELNDAVNDLAARARERRLTLDEIRGGTFSITNYGSIAGTYGLPILNYPEAAILGVGRIQRKPVVKNDEIVPGHVLALSLSIDHRIVDGGDAARFMNDLTALLADPVTMLLN